jgi:hypothetical protein
MAAPYSEALTDAVGAPDGDDLADVPVEAVDMLYDQVSRRLRDARADDGELGLGDFGVGDLPFAATTAMEFAEDTIVRGRPLTGGEKRAMVLRVAERLANEIPEGPGREAGLISVRVVLPGLIDLVVRASRGGLAINTWFGAIKKRCCFLKCGCGKCC